MIIDMEASPFDSKLAVFIYQLALYELPAKKIGDLVRSLTEDPHLRFADPYHIGYANEVAGVLLDTDEAALPIPDELQGEVDG